MFYCCIVFLVSIPPPPVPLPPIPCAHLELENGYISLNAVTEGGIAAFVCQEGYLLKGEETLTCEPSGQWSGDVPKCIRELLIIYVGLFIPTPEIA